MSESILNSVKQMLSISEDDTSFDRVVVMHINTVFSDLQQLDVGSEHGFAIQDASTTWETFLGDDQNLNQLQTYMYFRVRLMFDPPASQAAIAAMKEQAAELGWRLNTTQESRNWVNPFKILDPVTVPSAPVADDSEI